MSRRMGPSIAVAAVSALLLTPTVVTADLRLPTMGVRFEADAADFTFSLAGAEQLAEDKVIERMGTAFRFLEWDRSESFEVPDAEWVVVLREEVVTLTPLSATSGDLEIEGWRIFLEHYAVIGDKRFELRTAQRELYGLNELVPFQNRNKLEQRLSTHLSAQLSTEFLDLAEEHFLRLISLGDHVEAKAEDRRVVLPLRLQEIVATEQTLLGVRLHANGEHYGTVIMQAASRVTDGDLKGCVLGQIQSFVVPPIEVASLSLPFWWDDRLPAVFSEAQTREVYMHDYFLDQAAGTTTQDDLVIEADQ